MKKVHDWYLPEYDTHFEQWLKVNNEFTYQKKQRAYALERVKQFQRAIDIGGNVGFWSRDFCDRFKDVQIFEPDLDNLKCLKANLQGHSNYTIHEVGLSDVPGELSFYKSTVCCGGHSVFREQVFEETVVPIKITVRTLDEYAFTDVGLIKIDTQGSELNILKGARDTLTRESPVLNIEIEHKTPEQKIAGQLIHKYLEGLNYREIGRSRRKEVVFAKQ
jgi:FkbM family methyltransferase